MLSLMILCGGKGTRLREAGESLPKPLIPIGERPIVWHIMKSYAAFGVRHFILCLGYRQEAFVDYFARYPLRCCDATLSLGAEPEIQFHGPNPEADWRVTLARTGLETLTGGRVVQGVKYVPPEDEDFFLTYGDGVADVNVEALYRRHRDGGRALTITAVHPEARFGEVVLEGDRVAGFSEKPAQTRSYVNGGFMVVSRRFVTRYLKPDADEYLERGPMAQCAADGEMQAYRHEGFWQCMDNPREYALLNQLWAAHQAPWTKFWKPRADV